MTELPQALFFYLVFSLLGTIGLAITLRLFGNKLLAYVTAKPIGLLLFGYFIWLTTSFRILDYQNQKLINILLLLFVVAGGYLSYTFLKYDKRHEASKSKEDSEGHPKFVSLMIIEGLTLLIYLVYLYVRSHNAAVNGTERFMDMTLLTSAGKTHFFPFWDAWYASKTINYYYYGSYLMSLVSNISAIPYAVSYNLALGLLYCQSILLSAALVWSATKSKIFSVISAFLVTTAGNLFFANCVINSLLGVAGQVCSYASSTRLYTPSYIINEIPSYSFTVGDLHAHLLALPFFILNLVVLYLILKETKPHLAQFTLYAVLLASSGMINIWDFVTEASLLAVLVFIKIVVSWRKDKADAGKALQWLFTGLGSLALAFVLMVPNLINYRSPVIGLGFAPAYALLHNLKDAQYPTPLPALLGMWGVFLIIVIWLLIAKRRELSQHLFIILLGVVSVGILIGVELFFIEDIYSVTNPPFFRANTVFKFGYHAWVMLSLIFCISSYALIKKSGNGGHYIRKALTVIALLVVVIGGLYYPYQAVYQFYGGLDGAKELDGSAWLKDSNPDDAQVINYINNNFTDRAIVAEAVGNSYSTYGRISTYTGMITPMGWTTHEWTWRFEGNKYMLANPGQPFETGWGLVASVSNDMTKLYETADAKAAQSIIVRYKIQYVYVGNMERTSYPNLQEQKFRQLGRAIFSFGSSTLYAVTTSSSLSAF